MQSFSTWFDEKIRSTTVTLNCCRHPQRFPLGGNPLILLIWPKFQDYDQCLHGSICVITFVQKCHCSWPIDFEQSSWISLMFQCVFIFAKEVFLYLEDGSLELLTWWIEFREKKNDRDKQTNVVNVMMVWERNFIFFIEQKKVGKW